MFKNYFFLNKLVVEANKTLKGSKVTSVFSQEKDKIIFDMEINGKNKFIEISVNPGFPYLTVKDSFSRAKKNTVNFFENILPAELLALEIAAADRIIKIALDKGNFYFPIRGKYTNLILIDKSGSFNFFKNMQEDFSEESFKKEIDHTKFILSFNNPDLAVNLDKISLDNLKELYPFLGKEIITEAKVRLKDDNDDKIIPEIKNIITEVETGKPVVISDWQSSQTILSINSFQSTPEEDYEVFSDAVSALNYFIGKKYFFEDVLVKKKIIRKYLDNELTKLSGKLNNLKALIDKGSCEDEYQKTGNLLLINIPNIKPGMKEIEVPDIYSGNQSVKIKLAPSLSPKKNVERYFERAKDDKVKFEKARELYKSAGAQFKKLKLIEENFLAARHIEDYLIIMKELKIKEPALQAKINTVDISTRFKHYVLEGKYNLYVGKDSRNNDLLTTKFARQNDYWFHARSVSGSHAVLRVENTKEAIPRNILKKAAAIAAYHSKAKTSSLAPVSYTFKKFVVKKKGMEPGEVAMLKEEVLLVKPEIPGGCEFVSND